MQVAIELGDGFYKAMQSLDGISRGLPLAVSDGLAEAVNLAASNVATNYLTGQELNVRSGNLRRAVQGWMEDEFDGVVGVQEGSAVDSYKWLLGNEIRTITPKKGRLLAIPMGDNLSAAGVARKSSPRDFPDGWFQEINGRLFFVRKPGKRARLRILFLMVPSVTVAGTGALADGVLSSKDDMTAAIHSRVQRLIEST